MWVYMCYVCVCVCAGEGCMALTAADLFSARSFYTRCEAVPLTSTFISSIDGGGGEGASLPGRLPVVPGPVR